MDEEVMMRLSEITCQLNSLAGVLCGYCDNYAENSREISNLVEFSQILKEIANKLYDFL